MNQNTGGSPTEMSRKSMVEPSSGWVLFWFRRDLRIDDNAVLYHALISNCQALPVFIFDKHILGQLPEMADMRVNFIYNALLLIQNLLVSRGSSLLIIKGDPLAEFQQLADKYPVRTVYCNHDYEPCGIERDQTVAEWLGTRNIPFHFFKDQVIFEKSEISKGDGTPYTIFTPYSRTWGQSIMA